jgi:hypothetical protein
MSEGFTVHEDPANYAYQLFVGSSVDDAGLDVYEFRVYAHLVRRAGGPEGTATCGFTDICRTCRISRDRAHEAIHSLHARGVIRIEKFRDAKKNQDRNGYAITDRREWCPAPPRTVRIANGENEGTVRIANGTVRTANGDCSRGRTEGNPLKGNPLKETTTTPRACAHESAPAKAAALIVEAPSSSFSSVAAGGSEEPTGELSLEDRLELDQVANDFGFDGRQKAKAEACAKRRGMAFIREQADIVRTKPDVRNLAGAFERACDSPEGWKRPKAAAKKPARKKAPEPKPEEAPSEPQADFSAELAWWQSATDAQREAILIDPRFDLYRKSMRKGVTAASLGLPVLREVLAELAHEAACAATEMITQQQPQEEAA